MNYSFYFYAFVLFVLVVYTLRYAFAKFNCKKCGSWASEVRPHFEMNARVPHEYVETRYCSSCDEVIVDVARVEVHEVREDVPQMFKNRGSHRGGIIDG